MAVMKSPSGISDKIASATFVKRTTKRIIAIARGPGVVILNEITDPDTRRRSAGGA